MLGCELTYEPHCTEQRYSTFDRELLSIVLAVKHFLVAKPFIIRTDHKPLVNMMTMKNPSPRQQRQISYLSEFSFKITYLPGENNEVADFLSRSISVIKFRPIFTTERLLQFNQLSTIYLTFMIHHASMV